MAVRSLLAVLLIALPLAACGATEAADPGGATCDQFGTTPAIEQSRTIEAGTELMIVLCSNPSTGFAWGDPDIGDASVLRLVDRTHQAPAESSFPIVGAAGAEALTVRGVASGRTTLAISYGQSWADGTHGEWSYTLNVTVRSS